MKLPKALFYWDESFIFSADDTTNVKKRKKSWEKGLTLKNRRYTLVNARLRELKLATPART